MASDDNRSSSVRNLRQGMSDLTFLVIVLLAAGGLLASGVLGYLLFTSNQPAPVSQSNSGAATVIDTVETGTDGGDAAPTASGRAVAVAELSPLDPALAAVRIDDGTNIFQVTFDPPSTMIVDQQAFAVTMRDLSVDDALYAPVDGTSQLEWVQDTIINHVFRLPANEANLALMDRISVGDRITIGTLSGSSKTFEIVRNEISNVQPNEFISQSQPGISIVWAGELEQPGRRIIQGDFLLSSDQAEDLAIGAADIGETAQLGDVNITPLNATQLLDQSTVPAGFTGFEIELELYNTGQQPIDTGLFRFLLTDLRNNQYSPTNVRERTAAMSNFLEAGEFRTLVASYAVRSDLESERLTWQVSRVDSPQQINFVIPYYASRSADAAAIIQQATLSLDGTRLLIAGSVVNRGNQNVIISAEDLVLTDNAGTPYLVFAPAPNFPWLVEPGSSIPFSLTYQRPTADSAELQILTQRFELSNLR